MILREAEDGSVWRQAADNSWHQWDGPVDPPMVSAQDLQTPEVRGIITEMPDTTGAQGMDLATGIAGSAGQGATAGWLDEAIAGPMAGVAQISGDAPESESVFDTYNKMKDAVRARQRGFEASNPGADLTAKMAGGALPISRAAQGAGIAKTAAIGAGYGAAEYAGALDDWSDAELRDAALQTGLSAAMPAAMQKTGQGIRNWLANRDATEIDALIKRMVGTTGRTPAQLRNTADDMGPEASLADVSGTTGVGYAQGAVGAGGTRAAKVAEHNLSKIKSAKDRIRKTMSEVSGKEEGQYFESMDALQKNRRDNAEINYGKALDEGSVLPTSNMLRIFDNNPMVKDAWAEVQETYRQQGLPLPKLFTDVNGKSINVDGERWPNMRAMQELKWAMDKRLRAYRGSIDAEDKLKYQRGKKDYDEFMRDANNQNPDFAKANRAYAGDSAMIDAQEQGFKNGLGSVNVEAELDAISKMGKSEKDAYLQGALAKAYGKLGTTPAEGLGNVNQLSSENAFKVLSGLMGKQKANKLMKRLRTEKRYREVEGKVMQGSQTQPRQQAVSEIEGKMRDIPLQEIAAAVSPGNKLSRAARAVGMFNPKMSERQVAEFANIITKPGGVDKALLRLEMSGMGREMAEGIIGAYTKSLAAAAPAALSE